MSLNRESTRKIVNIASSGNLSTEYLDLRLFAGGMVIMPAAWTTAELGFKVCDTEDGTFVPLKDHDDAYVLVTGPVADTAYELPPEIFAARFAKLWSNDGAGSNTAQSQAAALTVMLKG